MSNQLRTKWNDFDGSTQTASINVSSEAYATLAAKLVTLQTEIDAWLIGRNQSVDHVLEIYEAGVGKANTPAAQASLQLILEIQDTTTGIIYRERLPMPYLGRANDAGGDPAWIAVGQGSNSLTVMNPDHAAFGTLKAAYDAVGESPAGNSSELVRAYIEA